MRYNRLGNSGLVVSELCLGTMTFGWAQASKPVDVSIEEASTSSKPAQPSISLRTLVTMTPRL